MKDKTGELLKRLMTIRKKSDLKKYIESDALEESYKQVHEYLLKVCRDKGFDKSDIITNADIYRTYGYQILDGSKKPSRDKLLQICVGNKFTQEETNRALTIANWGILYPKDPRDSIIIYSLNNGLSLMDTNIVLHESGFKALGESQ
ncbi:MAG: hypothetical protein ACOXZT_08740 [Tissierellaceae bacterium]|jgi:hypothetical protein|nr:XRE family transcriptional regulator [Tissierellia bacterium]